MGHRVIIAVLVLVFTATGCGIKIGKNKKEEDVNVAEFNSFSGAIYFDSKENYMRLDLSSGAIESFLASGRNMTSSSFAGDRLVTVRRSSTHPEILVMGRDKLPYIRIAIPDNPTGMPKLSPDGNMILIGGIIGETRVYDLNGKLVSNLRNNISSYDWMADGRILFSRFGTLYVTDQSLTKFTVHSHLSGTVGSLSISPDGREVAFQMITNGLSHIWVMDLSQSLLRQVTTSTEGEHYPSWSPDGRYLVLAKGKIVKVSTSCLELWIVNANSGAVSDLNTEDLANTFRVKQNVAGQMTETCATATPLWRLE